MDCTQLEHYRQVIETILNEYASLPYAYADIQSEVVFDRCRDRYLWMNVGWDGDRYIHGCMAHIDLIDGKIWIQRDGTEEGIAADLERAGIAKDQIVLGFRSLEIRPYTGYAVAWSGNRLLVAQVIVEQIPIVGSNSGFDVVERLNPMLLQLSIPDSVLSTIRLPEARIEQELLWD